MIKVRQVLQKHGYDIIPVKDNFVIVNGDVDITISQKEFEKLLFVKLVDLINQLSKK